jgi:hypothetical protein
MTVTTHNSQKQAVGKHSKARTRYPYSNLHEDGTNQFRRGSQTYQTGLHTLNMKSIQQGRKASGSKERPRHTSQDFPTQRQSAQTSHSQHPAVSSSSILQRKWSVNQAKENPRGPLADSPQHTKDRVQQTMLREAALESPPTIRAIRGNIRLHIAATIKLTIQLQRAWHNRRGGKHLGREPHLNRSPQQAKESFTRQDSINFQIRTYNSQNQQLMMWTEPTKWPSISSLYRDDRQSRPCKNQSAGTARWRN